MLSTLNDVLQEAQKGAYAVGAFNTPNLESVMAVVAAAEELGVPVILSHAEVHEPMMPIEIIGPIMLDFAARAKMPVVVHLDHGSSYDLAVKAIRLGFTSLMYDQSACSYEENGKRTAEVCKMAHAVGVSVEAELGHILNAETASGESSHAQGETDTGQLYTDPQKAREFIELTGADALAIAFGTAHGIYATKPVLDLNRIAAIREETDVPLVMHGGSGVDEAQYRTAIQNGITKINYFTYMSQAGGGGVARQIENTKAQGGQVFFHDIANWGIEAMKQDVKKAMEVFSMR
ncbi:MAG: class II fructose-bisphosphate aldolase [Christensenellales bacterium]|jgi:fructose-bisphosphate aldolase class II